jgi:hypothetical protein|tara:strand:- start:16556 stop:16666 length:111 start_codon:yes stop_codon:yes gene_type:complete
MLLTEFGQSVIVGFQALQEERQHLVAPNTLPGSDHD